jgi:hypothetical protein
MIFPVQRFRQSYDLQLEWDGRVDGHLWKTGKHQLSLNMAVFAPGPLAYSVSHDLLAPGTSPSGEELCTGFRL